MIDPGRLRTRLVLQAPNEADDGQGGVVRSYVTTSTIWADVTLLPGPERVEADADGATMRVRIVARAPLPVTLQHRLVDHARIYRITGYRDDGRLVVIDAEWRAG